MEETIFKTLMYMNQYVDTTLLNGGIYFRSKPYVYSEDETIESLIENARTVKEMTGSNFITESYFENLIQCQLVPIVIRSQEEDQSRDKLISEIRTSLCRWKSIGTLEWF